MVLAGGEFGLGPLLGEPGRSRVDGFESSLEVLACSLAFRIRASELKNLPVTQQGHDDVIVVDEQVIDARAPPRSRGAGRRPRPGRPAPPAARAGRSPARADGWGSPCRPTAHTPARSRHRPPPGSAQHALLVRQWSDDLVFFAHTYHLMPAEQRQLEARRIRVVPGEVARLVVEDDRLTDVELTDGRVVARTAVFVRPRQPSP